MAVLDEPDKRVPLVKNFIAGEWVRIEGRHGRCSKPGEG